MKKYFLVFLCCAFLCFVKQGNAGVLSWENSKRLSPNSFELYLEATDLDLNYLSGTWEVTNGKITNIVMQDGWINATGISNTFYYYRDGVKSGNYRIATITIELTSDSTTKMNHTDIGVKRCNKDSWNNFFNKSGNLVSETEYTRVCFNDDATLKDLKISSGTLTPMFQSQIDFYQVVVEHNVSMVQFSPVLNNSNAKVISSTSCNLNVGVNTCPIIIEAENKTQKVYTIEVTRKEMALPDDSSDATLKSLSSNVGVLSPNFRPDLTQYSLNVANEIEEITFYPIVNHANAKVISNTICKLNVGMNTCQIIVEAENQSRNTYFIQVTRDEKSDHPNPSDDATLKDLKMSSGVLSPTFQPQLYEYSSSVSDTVEFVIFSPIVNHNKAKIISGTTCILEGFDNSCHIVVEAENGNRQIYTIHVTKEKKEEFDLYDTSIRDFMIQNGTLTEMFDSNKKEYTIEVLEGTEVLIFQYIMNANNHQYTIPYEIDYSKPYYDLVISSLNQEKQNTYRFYIKVSSSNGGNSSEENPSIPGSNDIIDNPQTGDHLSYYSILLFIGFSILGILFISKKNIIRHI